MIIVSGTFEVDAASRDEALRVAATMTEASRAESGCVDYGFWADPGDPTRFRVFEEWKSAEALDAHFTTDHLAAFVAALPGLGVRNSDVWRYTADEKSKLM
ncbi:MAG: putative quinol monooxygenase [Acidimicrobiia bacterium]